MIFHLLLSACKIYHWTRRKEEEHFSSCYRITSQPKAHPLLKMKCLSSDFKDKHCDLEPNP